MKIEAMQTVVCGAVLVALTHTQVTRAGAWATLNYREINAASGVCWRSWAVMNVTNKAQGICDVSNDGIEPPTTNAPDYIGSGDQLSVNPATPPAVGYNGLVWNTVNQARGRLMGNIETTVTQQRQALYRAFSDYTITGAAYYMDGPQTYMDAGAPPTSNCYGAWKVDVVNPAYVIPFGLTAPAAMHVTAVSVISATGTVYTSPQGGNNQLEDGMVSVRWENVTLGTSGYVGVENGEWHVNDIPLQMRPPEPETNVLRFIAVGISPRPGLPVSQVEERYVLAIPEPGGVLVLMACVGVWVRRNWSGCSWDGSKHVRYEEARRLNEDVQRRGSQDVKRVMV